MHKLTECTMSPKPDAWQQAVVAASRGACSRSCGETSAGNPYLQPDWLPAITGQALSVWFNNCDAWWRGWDQEDARRHEGRARIRLGDGDLDRVAESSKVTPSLP